MSAAYCPDCGVEITSEERLTSHRYWMHGVDPAKAADIDSLGQEIIPEVPEMEPGVPPCPPAFDAFAQRVLYALEAARQYVAYIPGKGTARHVLESRERLQEALRRVREGAPRAPQPWIVLWNGLAYGPFESSGGARGWMESRGILESRYVIGQLLKPIPAADIERARNFARGQGWQDVRVDQNSTGDELK